jgi:hypothetical protein
VTAWTAQLDAFETLLDAAEGQLVDAAEAQPAAPAEEQPAAPAWPAWAAPAGDLGVPTPTEAARAAALLDRAATIRDAVSSALGVMAGELGDLDTRRGAARAYAGVER